MRIPHTDVAHTCTHHGTHRIGRGGAPANTRRGPRLTWASSPPALGELAAGRADRRARVAVPQELEVGRRGGFLGGAIGPDSNGHPPAHLALALLRRQLRRRADGGPRRR